MSRKLFVKRTAETEGMGIAGLQVAEVMEMEEREDRVMLTVYVKDADGKRSGPFEVAQDDTEISNQ